LTPIGYTKCAHIEVVAEPQSIPEMALHHYDDISCYFWFSLWMNVVTGWFSCMNLLAISDFSQKGESLTILLFSCFIGFKLKQTEVGRGFESTKVTCEEV